ncbi:tetratricopeptide repeat protein [Maritimibacter fusiformis]|uniref:Tetratricopeptide repeat protein n=1 Tax=Maritimibacter fusiformis TaxID=2603819 RepID=A0A5D0RMT9_9RHOB|nr:tetratricopeptide repeat protein [Maritimibacter fusiformis]TYB82439.1 tetratricopeptide repeat protein [Maritimibacter fusiformis]
MQLTGKAITVALAIACATPALSEPLNLTRDEMLATAHNALEAGAARQALAFVDAVLKVDPEDIAALVLKSRALRDLGRFDEAQVAAQTAWALSDDDGARYASAMALAQALSSDGSRTMAQVWLRRAHEVARSDAERALAVRGHQYVKARNPWSYTFSFGASPNSNLNNGSSADVLWIGNLPFTPVVYSGYTAQVSAGVSYRFSGANGTETHLGAQLFARINWFDADSLAVLEGNSNPNDSQHDYDYVQALATLRHVRPIGATTLELSANAGRTWYGWEYFADVVNLGAEWRMPFGEGDQIALFAKGRGQFFADPGDAPVYSGEAGARLRHDFSWGDRIEVTLAATGAMSDDAQREYLGGRGRVDYDLGQPLLGADLSFGLGAAYRDYPVSAFDPAGRQDWLLTASVEAALPDAAYMGFMPLISAEFERNLSNVPAFQSQALRFGLGIKSQF